MGSSPEFDAALAKTEYDKAIKSLVAAVKASAGYQARAEKAEAALARVAALHHRDGDDPDLTEWCAECCFGWPCSTIRALTEWNA